MNLCFISILALFSLLVADLAFCHGSSKSHRHDSLPDVTALELPWYSARLSGYYPASGKLEGGSKDSIGNNIHTLQKWAENPDPNAVVTIAMDDGRGPIEAGQRPAFFPKGTVIRIPSIEAKFGGRPIPFCLSDTGSAFRGGYSSATKTHHVAKGTTRIDVATANLTYSQRPYLNQEARNVPYVVTTAKCSASVMPNRTPKIIDWGNFHSILKTSDPRPVGATRGGPSNDGSFLSLLRNFFGKPPEPTPAKNKDCL